MSIQRDYHLTADMSGPPPAPGDRPRGWEWGWRAATEEQGVSLRPREDDLGPQLLRVQGPLQGPEVKGPGDVPARLALQGDEFYQHRNGLAMFCCWLKLGNSSRLYSVYSGPVNVDCHWNWAFLATVVRTKASPLLLVWSQPNPSEANSGRKSAQFATRKLPVSLIDQKYSEQTLRRREV